MQRTRPEADPRYVRHVEEARRRALEEADALDRVGCAELAAEARRFASDLRDILDDASAAPGTF